MSSKKSESYFLTPARGRNEGVNFADIVNILTRREAGSNLLYKTTQETVDANVGAGMPDGYAYELYRVTVEKVETTL